MSIKIFLNFKFNRWKITTKPIDTSNYSDKQINDDKLVDKESDKKLPLNIFNNYFSIGVDAKIALDFHLARGIIISKY